MPSPGPAHRRPVGRDLVDRDVEPPANVSHDDLGRSVRPTEVEVDLGVADGKIADLELPNEVRQIRANDPQATIQCLGSEAEGDGEEVWNAPGGPRLGVAGNRIADRDLEGCTLDPGEASSRAATDFA